MITVCLKVYCEAMQSDQYSKYDLAPDHVPAQPWQYQQLIRSRQLKIQYSSI